MSENILTTETEYGIFSYWPSDLIGNYIAQGHFWEPFLKPVFDELQPGSVVVDAGANIGWFTIYAAKRGAYVYAFEPCPEVFGLLKRNVEQNPAGGNVSLFPIALYERVEHLHPVDLGPENPANQVFVDERLDTAVCGNSGSLALIPGEGKMEQWAVTLDSFNLREVALIKTDAEGCDLEILKGARKTIERCRPVLCYEYLWPNPENPERLDSFNSFIEEIGYTTEQVHEGMEGQYREFIARPK